MLKLKCENVSEFLESARGIFSVSEERAERVKKWLGRVESLTFRTLKRPDSKKWLMDIEGMGIVDLFSEEMDLVRGDFLTTGRMHVEAEQLQAVGLEPMPQDLFGLGNFISWLDVVLVFHDSFSGTLYILDVSTQSYD